MTALIFDVETHKLHGKYKGCEIKDIDDQGLCWLLGESTDQSLLVLIENELLSRCKLEENKELPFI